ncbi:MAG TPA: copper chaperone PCu(A)C [Chromobacteriaceae bacterium]|nr:copper chaperone PCu(A)C [Chromobacteriaceae bacterium]
MKRLAAALLGLALSTSVLAHGYTLGQLDVHHPWSRAMPEASPTGAAYMTLTNQGKSDDRLLAASSPRAQSAELHTHLNDHGVMRMRPVADGIALPAGQQVKLAPGGLHIMLMGLKQPLKAGDHFPLTLKFEKAGSVTVDVQVENSAPH